MIRAYDMVLAASVVAAASATFWIKHDARELSGEVRALERRIAQEETAIELQRADWSVLSQPDRVQALVAAHSDALDLAPITSDQLVTLDTLSAELDTLAPASIEDALAGLMSDGAGGAQ